MHSKRSTMRRLIFTLAALTWCQVLYGQTSNQTSWVTDINPHNFSYNQGRVNALTVNPANPQIVFAGSELGGVFKSVDGGGHWTHVDAVTMFQINDIEYVSTNPDVIIVTGNYDGRVQSQGGIWRSVNGGVTWGIILQTGSGLRFVRFSISPADTTS